MEVQPIYSPSHCWGGGAAAVLSIHRVRLGVNKLLLSETSVNSCLLESEFSSKIEFSQNNKDFSSNEKEFFSTEEKFMSTDAEFRSAVLELAQLMQSLGQRK
jgi:hypothetical protein